MPSKPNARMHGAATSWESATGTTPQGPERMLPRHAQSPIVLAVVLAVMVVVGKLAFLFGASGTIPVVWPASGVALVAMLVLGRSIWPVIFLGTFLAYVDATGEIARSVVLGLGGAIEAFVGAV